MCVLSLLLLWKTHLWDFWGPPLGQGLMLTKRTDSPLFPFDGVVFPFTFLSVFGLNNCFLFFFLRMLGK